MILFFFLIVFILSLSHLVVRIDRVALASVRFEIDEDAFRAVGLGVGLVECEDDGGCSSGEQQWIVGDDVVIGGIDVP